MLEGRAFVHRNDSWMAVHRKCIHNWNSEIVFLALPFSKRTIFDFKLLLFHWRKDASITKTSGDAFLEWFTRCGEAPHGSVKEFLGVLYFHPLESKSSVKTTVPSANVNRPWDGLTLKCSSNPKRAPPNTLLSLQPSRWQSTWMKRSLDVGWCPLPCGPK